MIREYEWRKATRSGASGDNCVEVATNVDGVIAVRDSKDPHGPILTADPAEWRAFLSQLPRSSATG